MHHYQLNVRWTGNLGTGTSGYKAYSREHIIVAKGKEPLVCSSDIPFQGDGSKYNPEDMLLSSLSTCHMLWFLHVCADAGVIVETYIDNPEGSMITDNINGGRFTQVTLHPEVTTQNPVTPEMITDLHHKAHKQCFIANSVNFPVSCEPVFS